MTSSKWPCLSRVGWTRQPPEVASNLNYSVFYFFTKIVVSLENTKGVTFTLFQGFLILLRNEFQGSLEFAFNTLKRKGSIHALKINTLLEACRRCFSASNSPWFYWGHTQGMHQALCCAGVTSSPQNLFLPLGVSKHMLAEKSWYISGIFFFSAQRIATFFLGTVILTHIFYCSVHLQIWGLLWNVKAHTLYVSCGGGGKEAVSDVCCF